MFKYTYSLLSLIADILSNPNNNYFIFAVGFMVLRVATQEVDTLKKRIQRDGLKGSTYFCQQGGAVWVSASVDHHAICQRVLGRD